MNSPRRWWSGPFDVQQLAWDSVQRARGAAAELAAARGLHLTIDTTPELIAASFAAIDHLRIDGRVPHPWGEFSGFVAARDGWVRLHGNYPHHAAVLSDVLGVRDRAGLEREIGRREATDVEEQVTAAGGTAAAVRTEQQWREHPQAAATAGEPWVSVEDRGERPALGLVGGVGRVRRQLSPAVSSLAGPPTIWGPTTWRPTGEQLPLDGVRVLDLTRVIAGPTCTQLLACLGADVLRIDPPHRPELLDQHLSTGMGKRSALLDLRRHDDAEQLRALAAEADVILDGYRPGALAGHGLGTRDLERLAPQAVIVSLSAWGEHGPWGQRAGFDSIVQAVTGIAVRCGSEERPGALPVQALDHSSGHLIAAHVLASLAHGRAATVRVSLLGAARTLMALPSPSGEPGTLDVPRVRVPSAAGPLDAAPPPLLLDGLTAERPVGRYGTSHAEWMA